MPPPPRPKKKGTKTKSLVLPTSVVLAIPGGPPVLVGGPPTISLMALGMRIAMSGLGKAFKRLAKSKAARKAMAKFKKARQKAFKKMKPGFVKCKVLRAEPVNVVTGEVVVEQDDFSLPGRLPLEWVRYYGSQSSRIGHCGYGWETPADARLEFQSDGSVLFYDGTPYAVVFEELPIDGPVVDPVDGGQLRLEEKRLKVQTKEGLIYTFEPPNENARELLVTRREDLCGNYWEYIRQDGQLIEIRESAGRTIKVVSERGQILQLQLEDKSLGQPHVFVRYDYSVDRDLLTVYDALNLPYRFYYQNHCMTQHKDRNGLSFYYEYDEHTLDGRCRHTWGDGGLYDYQMVYDDETCQTQITNSLGHTSTIVLNGFNLIDMEIDPLGGVTKFKYDDLGRTVAVVDPDGNTTEYEYDGQGNLSKLTRPDGKGIKTVFNDSGKAERITDPNGEEWQQEWDKRGLLLKQVSPLGAESSYQYDQYGQATWFENPNQAITALRYDSHGNLTRLIDALDHQTDFEYDHLGNIISRRDALGQATRYRYDARGRLLQAILPSGASVSCGYDNEDNLVEYTDENGALTRLEYYGIGEIKRRIQPDGHTVEYHYDTEEQLIAVTNQRGEKYELRRDPLGQIVEEIDYWGQGRKYNYSAAGYLTSSTDPLNRTIYYETDPLGRILKKILPDPTDLSAKIEEAFEYDASGNLLACENPAGKIERVFDAESRMLEEKQGDKFQVLNSYDRNGNRIMRQTAFSGGYGLAVNTVHYQYDLLDQAIAVKAEGHAPIQLTRNALGQVTREGLGEAVRRDFEYNADGYLTAQKVLTNEGPQFEQQYQYDKAGNLLQRSDSVLGIDKYSYDPLGRILTHVKPDQELVRYDNDPAGDRLRTRINVQETEEAETWQREGEYQGYYYCFDRAGNLVKTS